MKRRKISREVLSSSYGHKPNNFWYRLISSQSFLAIIGLGFLLLIIFPLAKTYSQKRLIEKEIDDVKQQISDFENKNSDLKDMIVYLQSDQSLEEQARLNLNLKKPGEEVVVIEDQAVGLDNTNQEVDDSGTNNLKKWWRYFFN